VGTNKDLIVTLGAVEKRRHKKSKERYQGWQTRVIFEQNPEMFMSWDPNGARLKPKIGKKKGPS